MSRQVIHFYEFGPFRLDTVERCLLRGQETVPLTPKVYDTLLVLVENAGKGIEKDFLLRADPERFFTTPHYDGHPSVLVRLDAVERDELAELLTDSWRVRAPKRLAASLER